MLKAETGASGGRSPFPQRDSWMIDLTAHRPTQMNQILEGIATFIVCCKPDQIVRVAVDGVDGVGKTTFADKLGRVVELIGRTVIRSSVDGFHNPRELRYRRGRTSPEGFYFDSYDYPALRRYLLDPLGLEVRVLTVQWCSTKSQAEKIFDPSIGCGGRGNLRYGLG